MSNWKSRVWSRVVIVVVALTVVSREDCRAGALRLSHQVKGRVGVTFRLGQGIDGPHSLLLKARKAIESQPERDLEFEVSESGGGDSDRARGTLQKTTGRGRSLGYNLKARPGLAGNGTDGSFFYDASVRCLDCLEDEVHDVEVEFVPLRPQAKSTEWMRRPLSVLPRLEAPRDGPVPVGPLARASFLAGAPLLWLRDAVLSQFDARADQAARPKAWLYRTGGSYRPCSLVPWRAGGIMTADETGISVFRPFGGRSQLIPRASIRRWVGLGDSTDREPMVIGLAPGRDNRVVQLHVLSGSSEWLIEANVDRMTARTIRVRDAMVVEMDPTSRRAYAVSWNWRTRRGAVLVYEFGKGIRKRIPVRHLYWTGRLSSDGQRLLLSGSGLANARRIAVVGLGDGVETVLPVSGSNAVWVKDNDVVFCRGDTSIWQWNPKQQRTQVIARFPGPTRESRVTAAAQSPVVSADGRFLAWQYRAYEARREWDYFLLQRRGTLLCDLNEGKYRIVGGEWPDVAWAQR